MKKLTELFTPDEIKALHIMAHLYRNSIINKEIKNYTEDNKVVMAGLDLCDSINEI